MNQGYRKVLCAVDLTDDSPPVAAKAAALAKLADTSASKVALPFVEEQLKAARDLLGADHWPYGVAASRRTLDAFLDRHHREGLSSRRVALDEMFHPSTYETARI